MSNEFIKECNLCKMKLTAQDIIHDPDIQIIGMLYGREEVNSFYCFQHNTPECGTSFIMDVKLFDDFIQEKLPQKSEYEEHGCGSRCIHVEQLTGCESECYHAPYRRFLVYMIEQKKKSRASVQTNPETAV